MYKLYKLIFFTTLVSSTLMISSSISWLTAWMGLEMNLLSILPLMKEKNKLSSEASIKYFIVQAMASAILILSVITYAYLKTNLTLGPTAINSALLMKLGAAPFHFWFPEVMSGLTWNMNLLMLTWQKIGPMILLTYSPSEWLSILSVCLSSLISGVQGLNQTCLRKILSYSSINHMGWMISTTLVSSNLWTIYFSIYSLITLNLVIILKSSKSFFLPQLLKLLSKNKKTKFLFMMNLLSLGGMPPFLGFVPKWISLNFMVSNQMTSIAILLIMFTLLSLFIYTRIMFTGTLLKTSETLISSWNQNKFFLFYINFINLFSLMISLMVEMN
uniref:NADH-ubiquinone oxidoreductase chain 2 n=1 Tax=Curculionoidea sp. 28 KM-2017 TaxID=2219412 RepID=A0A346RJ64_9CUCU|nr:NADH dehydrogenase subunit 2 [Curculionoidea sp. 28 KM-2017]